MPGLKFEVRPSDAEENLDKKAYSADPSLFAVDTARLKANDIFDKITADQVSVLRSVKIKCNPKKSCFLLLCYFIL